MPLNVNGQHPLTLSSDFFIHVARSTFIQFTCSSGAQKWLFIRFGTSTIKCAVLWTQTFCSGTAVAWLRKETHRHLRTLNFGFRWTFEIFDPAILAGMESRLCNMNVSDFLSSCSLPDLSFLLRGTGILCQDQRGRSRYGSLRTWFPHNADFYLEDDIMVEFSDQEDELY